MAIQFSACPKCRGDLQLRRDIYGRFVNCFQCGLQQDPDAPTVAVEVVQSERAVATSHWTRELLPAA